MTYPRGVFPLTRRTWSWLIGVAVLTAAALGATWIGGWVTRHDDDAPRITTQPLPPSVLPRDDMQAPTARGELAPDDRDAALARDVEFLSWYAHRRESGAPPATSLSELPETMGESDTPEGADAQ